MTEDIPYWNVNIPREAWTAECPPYLQDVDEFDRAQLHVRDEDYALMTWPEVEEIIRANRLDLFKRVPSDLRRYRKWMAQIKTDHGNVLNYLLSHRLKWSNTNPVGGPFEFDAAAEDSKILINDWPYGLDPKILHLVVWTKFELESDPTTGDLTDSARRIIDDYVSRTFRAETENPQHIIWFKNPASLKSVHAVEHFHIMMYDPDMSFIARLTDGDVAKSDVITDGGT